ncbi:MAG: MBL fold metallo-hydrolase [Halioglobus sp.]|nr:MBL fold metallo-hydrolase [Halioglobus sp.]
MNLQRIETPGIAHFSYLLVDGEKALVVDPRRDVDVYLREAQKQGAHVTHILETHRQEDFVMGSTELARLTGAKVANGQHDFFGRGDLRLADSEEMSFSSLHIRALSTPGHTPESMCYAVYTPNADTPWCIFTGDTLFFGETGRTDLPDDTRSEDNARMLYDSVQQKLAGLGDTALVLPAHGPGSVCGSGMADRPMSTLGEEKQYNVVFTKDRETFAKDKGGERLPRPPYFRLMEKVNLEGGRAMAAPPGAVPLLSLDDFSKRMSDAQVYDTREPEAFAGGHIEDAYSIWLGGLPVFGGWVAEADEPILLVTDRDSDITTAGLHLARIGYDNLAGAMAGGFGAWRKSANRVMHSGVITPVELHEDRETYQILDVREPDEFSAGHIDGAHSLYVGYLERDLEALDLDRERPVVVTCGVGHRAGLGVSMLKRMGFKDVRNLIGGMSAWQAMKLPTRSGD